MTWDTTIASNVAYIAALLYNQNNVASMASGVTLQLEREAARDLCRMVGYNVTEPHHPEGPRAWGHLPNGGTVANLEAMWAARWGFCWVAGFKSIIIPGLLSLMD